MEIVLTSATNNIFWHIFQNDHHGPLYLQGTHFPWLETKISPWALKGAGGGVPWGKIMENEFEGLTDGRGLGGYFSEEFVPKESYSRPD